MLTSNNIEDISYRVLRELDEKGCLEIAVSDQDVIDIIKGILNDYLPATN